MKAVTLTIFFFITFITARAQCCTDSIYPALLSIAQNDCNDAVRAAALWAISQTDPAEAMIIAQACEKDCKSRLSNVIFGIYTTSGGDLQWPYVYTFFKAAREPFYLSEKLGDMAGHLKNPMYAQEGIEALKELGITCIEYSDKISAILSLIKNNRLLLHDDASAEAAEMAITALEDRRL
jgi:aminopeptidase N